MASLLLNNLLLIDDKLLLIGQINSRVSSTRQVISVYCITTYRYIQLVRVYNQSYDGFQWVCVCQ